MNLTDSNISVYGNGKTLGLTDGTNNNLGLFLSSDGARHYASSIGDAGKNVGTTASSNLSAVYKLHGVVTSGESGLVCNLNSIKITCKYVIKY